MGRLDLREWLSLKHLAALINPDSMETIELPFCEIFDGEPDTYDKIKFQKVIDRLIHKGIIEECSSTENSLIFKFSPSALPFIHKLITQLDKNFGDGKGPLFAKAMLALKRSLGIKGDVWYREDFDTENFDFGEYIGYLDMGFKGNYWRMEFSDEPGDYLERAISVYPGKNELLLVTQSINYDLPDCDEYDKKVLAELPVEDFINPDSWKNFIPEIVDTAKKDLENAAEKLKDLMRVQTRKGLIINKMELLKDMEAVVQEHKIMCEFFGRSPNVRSISEWPVDCERRGYFRECEYSLKYFNQNFLPGLSQTNSWYLDNFMGEIWLTIFKNKFAIEPDWLDLEDFGSAGCAKNLQEEFPEKAAQIERDYNNALENSRIRIAWGLYTKDFNDVRAFVNAALHCDPFNKSQQLKMGFGYPYKLDYKELKSCMKEAAEQTLKHKDKYL